MNESIILADLPEFIVEKLEVLAHKAGMSLPDFARAVLTAEAARLEGEEVISQARARVDSTGVSLDANAILESRDADAGDRPDSYERRGSLTPCCYLTATC